MKFFSIGYTILTPVLLLLGLCIYTKHKKIIVNLIATMNFLMIFFSLYTIYHVYEYYQIATLMGFELFPNGKIVIGWQEAVLCVVVLLPFLFFFKKLQSNLWLSFLLTISLVCNFFYSFIFSTTATNSYIPQAATNYFFYSIEYLCWITGMYAMLWLIKRF